MAHAIVPISQIGSQIQEQGRIRLGVKVPASAGKKGSMKWIDTFRFTSAFRDPLDQLANLYGGTVEPWHDDKASPRDQFQVTTEAKKIEIWLPPSGQCVSQHYEQWGGGGVVRRCDGVTVQVAGEEDMVEQPCICEKRGELQCRLYTRISVVLPNVQPFGGTWRLETKGWNAGKELPSFVAMLEQMQARGLTHGTMRIDVVEKMVRGRKQQYVVPRLEIPESPMVMLTGGANVDRPALTAGPKVEPRPALAAAASDEWDQDDVVVDAEIVDDEAAGLAAFAAHTSVVATAIAEAALVAPAADMPILTEVRRALTWMVTSGEKHDARTLTEGELVQVVASAEDATKDIAAAARLVEQWRAERPM